jgi:Leucine-rich repeat (LRR) protein
VSAEKIISFPAKISLGDVFLLNGGVPRYLGQAQGQLSVPEAAKVKLVIGEDGANSVNSLSSLNEDDLYSLSLYSMKINVEIFPLLSALKGLHELDLGKIKLTKKTATSINMASSLESEMDKMLSFLKDLKELRVLTMPYTNVSDTGMPNLSGFKHLEVIDLEGNIVTDKGLSYLKDLIGLRVIDLEDNKITDEGMNYFKDMKRLEVLDIEGTEITDQGLSKLSHLNSLRWIRLRATKITNDGLAHLKNLTNLKMIEVQDTEIGDAGLAYLAKLEQLEELDFAGSKVTKAGVAKLKESLPNCKINLE